MDVQSKPRALGYQAYAYLRVQRRSDTGRHVRSIQAHPLGVQLGVTLTHSAPLAMEELVHLKSRLALEHIIDGPRELVSQDGQGFPLVVFFLQAGEIFLPCRIVAQEQRRSLGKGPLEVGVPDFFAGRAQAFARRFLGTLDQATIGDEILHRRKAINVVNFVEQHEAEDLADPRHGL